jgi:hypothetical protein
MEAECDKRLASYLRYADDQYIMADDKEILYDILFSASKELFKINLNINSSKVREFTLEEFITYWAFEIFEKLEDKQDKEKINQGVEMYFQWAERKIDFKKDSVLKRIITVVSKNINILNLICGNFWKCTTCFVTRMFGNHLLFLKITLYKY